MFKQEQPEKKASKRTDEIYYKVMFMSKILIIVFFPPGFVDMK
jgi:hypothetical protein